ncbi:hypothetical protein [Nannocystis pusilla]|uniref:hypothetical protein n=1 Tax=Nannocystis pusilla TaxID=889268 RepID=UPI003B780B06
MTSAATDGRNCTSITTTPSGPSIQKLDVSNDQPDEMYCPIRRSDSGTSTRPVIGVDEWLTQANPEVTSDARVTS